MSDIIKHEGFNLGSIAKIQFAPFHYFESITKSKTDIKESDIIFNSGKTWIESYFTPGTAKYSDYGKQTPSGIIHLHNLIFNVPKIRRELYAELYKYMGIRIVVKLTDANGAIMLLGDKIQGLKMSFTKTLPGDTASYNGTSITISGKTTFPSLDIYS